MGDEIGVREGDQIPVFGLDLRVEQSPFGYTTQMIVDVDEISGAERFGHAQHHAGRQVGDHGGGRESEHARENEAHQAQHLIAVAVADGEGKGEGGDGGQRQEQHNQLAREFALVAEMGRPFEEQPGNQSERDSANDRGGDERD